MNLSEIINAVINFLTSTTFTALVNLISVIGLLLTAQVYLNVKKIEKFYMFTGRIPDLVKNLQVHASNIIGHLNDFDSNIFQIQTEFTHVIVVLESLKKKTDGDLKRSISQLLKEVKDCDLKTKSSAEVRIIYLDIVKVHAQIMDLQKDQKWKALS